MSNTTTITGSPDRPVALLGAFGAGRRERQRHDNQSQPDCVRPRWAYRTRGLRAAHGRSPRTARQSVERTASPP